MRSLFSIRFFAAIGAVLGLFAVLGMVFGSPVSMPTLNPETITGQGQESRNGPPEPTVVRSDEIQVRRIDFVARVFAPREPGFTVSDHLADSDIELTIDGERSLFIKKGTPGDDYCHKIDVPGARCAVAADLLGEGVVWFALVPYSAADDAIPTVDLPAIDELIDGYARLVNGWELPYDPVLTRICGDDDNPDTQDDFASYREFRELMGDDFVSVFSLRQFEGPSRLSAVRCREQVPFQQESIDDAKYRYELQ